MIKFIFISYIQNAIYEHFYIQSGML